MFSPENSPGTGKLLWLNGKDLLLASKSNLGECTQYDDGRPKITDANQSAAKFIEPVIVEEIGPCFMDIGCCIVCVCVYVFVLVLWDYLCLFSSVGVTFSHSQPMPHHRQYPYCL